MEKKYEFFIAGKTRNKENILKICDLFDKYNISYYCFLKNEETMNSYGDPNKSVEENMKFFESLSLKSDVILDIFHQDLDNQKVCKNFLLVLPSGTSGHIEAGISYGMGKRCFAVGEYSGTDSLYNIFEEIFQNSDELEKFLKEYSLTLNN
ncbi:MAG: hypothetical protein J5634_02300 [Bacilli bacterium]|nr:hypothetical protein [Bacilli bacterium]